MASINSSSDISAYDIFDIAVIEVSVDSGHAVGYDLEKSSDPVIYFAGDVVLRTRCCLCRAPCIHAGGDVIDIGTCPDIGDGFGRCAVECIVGSCCRVQFTNLDANLFIYRN